MPLLQSRFCHRCRSSQFRRSHTKNLIERAVRFAIVPVRCQYCGHRRYNSRWTVSQLGKTAEGAPAKTKGPQDGVTSNVRLDHPTSSLSSSGIKQIASIVSFLRTFRPNFGGIKPSAVIALLPSIRLRLRRK
jgi:hypothetical protein